MDQPTNQQGGAPAGRPIGPVVGIVVIVLILILGGLYFWGEKLNQENGYGEPATTETSEAPDAQTEGLSQQGSSDNLSDIEADLQSTNTADLDAGLDETGL